jgi:hypothetical protein
MTVRVNKDSFNIREKLSELERPIGLKGSELMSAATTQEARDFISAGRKNKIINGAMLIDQRHGGASSTNSNGHHTDRFRTQVSGMDQLVQTYQQISDGPPGFPKSLKITTTGPETTIVDNEYLSVYQKIEGQNLQDFAYGTSSAKSVTVSFYVKSSITGTFGYTVYRNESTDRAINKTYTINNANTWERKTITLEGDTAQAIGNANADNWWNCWHLASSPYYKSDPAPRWANYDGNNWAGYHEQNGVVTTNGATWQITGVQIEIGKNATDFEHRSYGEELALCQRYYYTIPEDTFAFQYRGSHRMLQVQFPQQMRANPTISGTFTPSSWSDSNYKPNNTQYSAYIAQNSTDQTNVYITNLTFSSEL